mmetsp:Transcript_18287/g.30501  ORF Transcript_18287/g.30501 Transcript_18287/m.30501 type:complete len:365 (+) Transcript_18287:120-1214(+)
MNSLKNNITSVFRDKAVSPSSPRRLGSGGRKRKRVTWAPNVLDSASSAASLGAPVIILCAALVNQHMQYTIKIRQKDCEWNVSRRYSEFVSLHAALLEESLLAASEFPPLPKKRWFELGRWTQRHDDIYNLERKLELQQYLQRLFSINKKILLQKSKVLQRFIEFQNRYKLSVNTVLGGTDTATDPSAPSYSPAEVPGAEVERPHNDESRELSGQQRVSGLGLGLGLVMSTWRQQQGPPHAPPASVASRSTAPSADSASASLQSAVDSISISTGAPYAKDIDVDSDSEGSVDSGFGEHDAKLMLESKNRVPERQAAASGRPDSSASSLVNAFKFIIEICKSDYWIFIIAFALLLLSQLGWIPES